MCVLLHVEAILSHDAHAAVLRRFGRYPHRNELLGRESTEEAERRYGFFVHGLVFPDVLATFHGPVVLYCILICIILLCHIVIL